MKLPVLPFAMIVGALALAQTGCHQAEVTKATAKPAKPDDPTAWSDKDVTRGTSDSGAGDSGLPASSGVKGTWSREGQDIERSLGVGR